MVRLIACGVLHKGRGLCTLIYACVVHFDIVTLYSYYCRVMGVSKESDPNPEVVTTAIASDDVSDDDSEVEYLSSTITAHMVKGDLKGDSRFNTTSNLPRYDNGGNSSSSSASQGSGKEGVSDDSGDSELRRSGLQLNINQVLGKTPPSPAQERDAKRRKSILQLPPESMAADNKSSSRSSGGKGKSKNK